MANAVTTNLTIGDMASAAGTRVGAAEIIPAKMPRRKFKIFHDDISKKQIQ